MPPAGERKADDDLDQRTTEDGCQDRGWRSPESHSDADLLCSLADDVGHHPVDANGRDDQSEDSKKREQRHVEPPFGPTCPRSSPTSRGTYEHEVREVDTGNEKYERDRAQQQEHSRAQASCHELAQGLDLCDAVREPSRCLGGKRSRDLIHPGLRLLDTPHRAIDRRRAGCSLSRESRLARDFGTTRFGSEGYAIDELVAELGAAFLCADLDLTLEPREDHAAYIANWLDVLKADNRAIFTAASHAQRAADFINRLQPASAG
jgi:Zincin-like metallopeptidase